MKIRQAERDIIQAKDDAQLEAQLTIKQLQLKLEEADKLNEVNFVRQTILQTKLAEMMKAIEYQTTEMDAMSDRYNTLSEHCRNLQFRIQSFEVEEIQRRHCEDEKILQLKNTLASMMEKETSLDSKYKNLHLAAKQTDVLCNANEVTERKALNSKELIDILYNEKAGILDKDTTYTSHNVEQSVRECTSRTAIDVIMDDLDDVHINLNRNMAKIQASELSSVDINITVMVDSKNSILSDKAIIYAALT